VAAGHKGPGAGIVVEQNFAGFLPQRRHPFGDGKTLFGDADGGIENFREFLEARKALLAVELNHRMEDLLHGDTRWLAGATPALPVAGAVAGGITSEEEEQQLEGINDWMEEQGLPRGTVAFDFADAATGEQKAVFDLAWPSGIQEEFSQPVAVLLSESSESISIASQAGYRCFSSIEEFRRYVMSDIVAGGSDA